MSVIRSNPNALVLSQIDGTASLQENNHGHEHSENTSIYQKSRGFQGFQPNLTGSAGRYMPYSTVKPKVEKWENVVS